jgi:CO dehydrogenase maturation factor
LATTASEALAAEGIALAGVLPYDAPVAAADRAGHVGLTPVAPDVQRALDDVLDALDAAQVRLASSG